MISSKCPKCSTEFTDEKEMSSYDALWDLIVSGLSNHNFMTLDEYNTKCREGVLTRKTIFEDDLDFYRGNPMNPMALDNRSSRIDAGDAFRKFVTQGKAVQYINEEMLSYIHKHLFDCCASVRQSLIIGLIVLGNKKSFPYFEELALIEDSESNKEMLLYAVDDYRSGRNLPLENLGLFGL